MLKLALAPMDKVWLAAFHVLHQTQKSLLNLLRGGMRLRLSPMVVTRRLPIWTDLHAVIHRYDVGAVTASITSRFSDLALSKDSLTSIARCVYYY